MFAHSHDARKHLSSSVEMLKDRALKLVDNPRNDLPSRILMPSALDRIYRILQNSLGWILQFLTAKEAKCAKLFVPWVE